MADNAKTPRPVYRNIHVTDIVSYRLPPAGIVSILHRISGVVMFLLLPFIIWMFDTSVTSEITYDQFTSVFEAGCADGAVPGWFFKLIALGLIWAYLHHFIAGVRHLIMDVKHTVSKEQGHSSALITLGLSIALTVVLGAKLFGLF
ncbi:MAG TPA: succinate dehydrogenase, cytochrome b556 subunit [Aquabacterium sp.]|uniref:succinate dehydrogenase, cytochrome b556 subunit n=1 Tax=Aquabacterium sp. TaxID=1872578 RepID=UPI002E2EB859|nr:succinate dehydrogenase, cytochrome b556 subunit [Aquabacterium sp.]HEX5372138.1 succinate dehydrogenase, cytochrome b556 subunit [Aquabacterium sp.]